jgi:hypothetical protein
VSRTIAISADVPVLATKQPDGSLSASTVMLAPK